MLLGPLALFALTACESGVIERPVISMDRGPIRWDLFAPRLDRATPQPDLPARPKDQGVPVDLPTEHLSPCLTGKCGGGMLCIANLCRKTCNQSGNCNDKTGDCDPGEACVPASSFADACFPAVKVGDDCSTGQICPAGSMCVHTGTAIKCLKLCKYGCSQSQCRKTQQSPPCEVCLQ